MASVGRVTLQIADLDRSLAFYRDLVGYRLIDRDRDSARLGAHGDGARVLLELREKRGANAVPRRGRLGLYHFALLLPDRPALGRFLQHIQDHGVRAGNADHVVSEALYLTDPDGLIMEVYRDRPRAEWTERDGEVVMATDPMDIAGVLAAGGGAAWSGVPAGSIIGHMHFYVDDLVRGYVFYHEALGLERRVWNYPGALFLAADGYHHHVAINTWAAGSPMATDDDAKLIEWEWVLPDRSTLDQLRARFTRAGVDTDADSNAPDIFVAQDPWGNKVRVIAEHTPDR